MLTETLQVGSAGGVASSGLEVEDVQVLASSRSVAAGSSQPGKQTVREVRPSTAIVYTEARVGP